MNEVLKSIVPSFIFPSSAASQSKQTAYVVSSLTFSFLICSLLVLSFSFQLHLQFAFETSATQLAPTFTPASSKAPNPIFTSTSQHILSSWFNPTTRSAPRAFSTTCCAFSNSYPRSCKLTLSLSSQHPTPLLGCLTYPSNRKADTFTALSVYSPTAFARSTASNAVPTLPPALSKASSLPLSSTPLPYS